VTADAGEATTTVDRIATNDVTATMRRRRFIPLTSEIGPDRGRLGYVALSAADVTFRKQIATQGGEHV
jgi:hypothetical protein